MKIRKYSLILILPAIFSICMQAQCDVFAEEIMDNYCVGTRLQYQEITGENNQISLFLGADDYYRLYLLNPSTGIEHYDIIIMNPGIDFKSVLLDKEHNAKQYLLKSEENSGEYDFEIEIEKEQCVLLAIYKEGMPADDNVYPAGIYYSNEHLISKSPDHNFEGEIIKSYRRIGSIISGPKYSLYQLRNYQFDNSVINKAYAFSNGQDIYINPFGKEWWENKKFSELEIFGDWGYFYHIHRSSTWNGSSVQPELALWEFGINLLTGELIKLNKKSVRELLAGKPDLLNEFESERRKNKVLKKYFLKSIDHN